MRLIDADALEKKLQEQRGLYVKEGMKGAEHLLVHDFLRYVWEAPTIEDPFKELSIEQLMDECFNRGYQKAVRCGKWIVDLDHKEEIYVHPVKCSVCGATEVLEGGKFTHYCPTCGARMEGMEE